MVSSPRPSIVARVLALCRALPLAAISLRAALLLLALLAARNKVHLFAVGFCDPLSDHALVKAADKLLYGFTIASFYMHDVRAASQLAQMR
jgi:hypothetical protein